MRLHYLWISCIGLALTACSKDPAVEYRLSPEQMAWQGYTMGEELRFGNSATSKVRNYLITEVQNKLETEYMGLVVAPLPFPRKEDPLYQQITVWVQRTDTTVASQQVLELGLHYDPVERNPALRATAEWETFPDRRLPVDEINNGLPIDTTQYPGTELLQNATLGSITYARVIHLFTRPPYSPTVYRRTSDLYYAPDKGVVAYREAGTGLWYRLR